MGEADFTTLGASVDLMTGFPFKSDRFSDEPTDIRLLRGDNIAQGVVRWSGAKRWPIDEVPSDYLLRPGDVVLAMDRPWIEAGLKHATLTDKDCPSLLVQRVACLRARPGLDQRFLSYLIRSQAFTDYVLGVQTGTAVPHLSGSQIRAFRFKLPPLTIQEATGDLLGALDDKIELNRQMAGTLEEAARALFKSWFIDFDPVRAKIDGRSAGLPAHAAELFPDSFNEDGLPRGWVRRSLDQIVAQHRDMVDPATLGETIVDHFSLPAFDADASPTTELASAIKSIKLNISGPIILFSKLNPQTPRVWPILKPAARPMLASTEFLAFRPSSVDVPFSFVEGLLASQSFRAKAAGMVTGTSKSHQRVQPKALLATEWAVAPKAVLAAFDKIAGVSIERRASLIAESTCLAEIRDSMLPRLIAGDLRIRDGDKVVAA